MYIRNKSGAQSPEQRLILAKLRDPYRPPVHSTPTVGLEWNQRRIKFGLTLWVARTGKLYYVDIRTLDKVSVFRGSPNNRPVKPLSAIYDAFDRTVNLAMSNTMNELANVPSKEALSMTGPIVLRLEKMLKPFFI